jgi:Tol biopolymer transport system component
MNQAEKTKPDALKEMTYRSSKRVPYFINDNVQNITGKDWMTLWSDWVQETKIQKSSELAELSKTPETSFEWITPDKNTNILGHAISPKDANGDQWIAYQQESSDERSGLYLRNLRTGTQERLTNKISGKGLAFTPNGRYLLYSSLNRTYKYDLYSDLFAYDLKQRSVIQLTDRQRAKDPSLSVDASPL